MEQQGEPLHRWTDIALSPRGIAEAKQAGELLKARGVTFDLCFTSYLNRTSETLRIVLDTMNVSHVPVQKDWRLNERHYGTLQVFKLVGSVKKVWGETGPGLTKTLSRPTTTSQDGRHQFSG